MSAASCEDTSRRKPPLVVVTISNEKMLSSPLALGVHLKLISELGDTRKREASELPRLVKNDGVTLVEATRTRRPENKMLDVAVFARTAMVALHTKARFSGFPAKSRTPSRVMVILRPIASSS